MSDLSFAEVEAWLTASCPEHLAKWSPALECFTGEELGDA